MAIAPQRAAIGIRRRFTTEGVHPYDEVRWERRDARITNFRDGTVAFEQLGVEVPEFWSLNATNILAQKYFRGTLGTPEREWSLKQVADRVVDTITAWGVKDGYFVDQAEAETFRDELKHLIIHQKAAFNSPVWFNIGVHDVPQQGSACQPYDALVSTPEGMVPIGRLVEENALGAKVLDAHGVTRILAVKHNGQKQVLRIHTVSGHQLDVTPDHLAWRATDEFDCAGAGAFVQAGELRPGDVLVACTDGRAEPTEVQAIEALGAMDVYDIQTESGEYLSGDLRVHNCFILSVDDSMDSILNWYVEEGVIFKGGSGAGVNLSRIRSSHELLKGGGTASGPVSFMRGADASAGTIKSGGKCFRGGTLVSTPGGWRPVEQLRVGDVVLTHEGPRAVADFMPNGEKQCYRVVTREGYEVEVTAGHKFAYWNEAEGGFEVKPIEEFSAGDSLYVLLEPSEGGVPIPLLPPEIADPAEATTTVEMRLPTVLDDRLAYVLGLAYGAGELRTEHPYRLRIASWKDEAGRASVERFSSYCEELFGERPIVLGEASGHQQVGFARKRLIEFLRVNGIAKGRADELGFPSLLLQTTPDVRAAFLAGVIDADGSSQPRGGWSVSSVDRAFLRQLQLLALSLGVASKLRVSRPAAGTRRTLYRLDVVGATFVDRLVARLRPYSAKVQVVDGPSPAEDKGWADRPPLPEPLATRVQRAGGSRAIGRGAGVNGRSGGGGVALLTRHPDAPVADRARGLTTTVQVSLEAVVPTDVAQTYDIEVEGTHLLSANGLYASNTRRAAKMVILDADHPDIEDFIWCKALEERKARVLRDAGFDMDLDGADSHSIQYQNANNSVRVTDEFMQAVLADADWDLTARTDGSVIRRVKARDLFRQIAHAAWECADPGMQFDTTINSWHTAPNTGRINGSNPCCFAGDTQILTSQGLVAIAELQRRSDLGGDLPSVLAFDPRERRSVERHVVKAWVAGYTAELVDVVTHRGRFRCTPEHRFLTREGYVEAADLRPGTALESVGPEDLVVAVERVCLAEEVPVYDMEVEELHNFVVASSSKEGVVVSNSEYMHLDNSACNLASLNLLKFLNADGSFDVEGFKAAVEVVFTGQEIIVGNADYPTEKIAENSRRFRELGIGYANLGALLMANGLPYDSDAGRAWAGAVTALMTGHAYATSARTASRMGPFAGFHENAEAMVHVLRMHQSETSKIDEELVPPELLSAAQQTWDEAVELAEQYGVRNSQASVLAPTGTIGLLMDCDTTGVEPDLGLVKTKKLVGGGTMSIVNQTVPRALRQLGYAQDQIDQIVAYIDEHKTIVGAPYLVAEHLPVFACSMGDNTIHYSGHVRMMGAVQPFISGAISKTINMPEDVSVEDVEQIHIDAWRLGIKAVAIYRDNCKVAQPLSTTKKEGRAVEGGDTAPPGSDAEAKDREVAARIAELEKALEHERARKAEPVLVGAVRERLPRRRRSNTFAFRVADCEGYVTVGEYEDGRPGEVFIKVSKQGSTLAGIMDAFSISISLGLQHGVPLATYVRKYSNMKFEPAGITDDAELRIATSLVDYIFRRLALDYLTYEERLDLGVLSTSERIQPTLPGVEESATPSIGLIEETPDLEAEAAAASAEVRSPRAPRASATDAAAALARAEQRDAPFCYSCGNVMQRAGSCYVCPSCGSTSGCS